MQAPPPVETSEGQVTRRPGEVRWWFCWIGST